MFGIAGAIVAAVVGAVATHTRERRRRREDDLRQWELQRLDAAEKHLKRLAASMSASLVLPSFFTAYRTVDVLRDFMYLDPTDLDNAAINEMLELLHEGVQRRPGLTQSAVGSWLTCAETRNASGAWWRLKAPLQRPSMPAGPGLWVPDRGRLTRA
ncbi:MAG TPA: hypothetical protein VM305_04040 [Candidatus Limnocylindrales bacterium]|nr:hypothetical protein [Candidatus Limnocylindrales bacterium]